MPNTFKKVKKILLPLLVILAILTPLLQPHTSTQAYLSTEPPPGPVDIEPTQTWNIPLIGDVYAVKWSPDGTRFAVITGPTPSSLPMGSTLHVYNADGTEIFSLSLDGLVGPHGISWSPDGTRIAVIDYILPHRLKLLVISSDGATLWENPGDLVIDLIRMAYHEPIALWSPDGAKLVVAGASDYSQGNIYMFSREGDVLWTCHTNLHTISSLAWSPDSSTIVIGMQTSSPNAQIIAYSADDCSIQWATEVSGSLSYEVKWSPTGDFIAAASRDSETGYYIYKIGPDGTLLWQSPPFTSHITKIALPPYSDTIGVALTSEETNEIQVYDVYDSTGNLLWQVSGISHPIRSLGWNPTGTILVAGTGTVAPWEGELIAIVGDGTTYWKKELLGGPVFDFSWSPDGSNLVAGVAAQYYGLIYILNSDGTEENIIGSGNPGRIIWSPDDSKIAHIIGGTGQKLLLYSTDRTLLWATPTYYRIADASWNPDSSLIAIGTTSPTGSELIVYRVLGGIIEWSQYFASTQITSVAWSPDGSKLAVSTNAEKLLVYNPAGTLLWSRNDLGAIRSISWNPADGRIAIATQLNDGGTVYGKIIILSPDGTDDWSTGTSTPDVVDLTWSPDGTLLAVNTGSTIKTYSNSGGLEWSLDTSYHIYKMAWSPDSAQLAILGSYQAEVLSNTGTVLWSTPLGLWLDISWSRSYNILAASKHSFAEGYSSFNLYNNDGTLRWESPHHENPESSLPEITLEWSHNGEKLAVADLWGLQLYEMTPIEAGQIAVTALQNTHIIIDSFDYLFTSTDTLTIWASPGDYYLYYEIHPPADYIGSPEAFTGRLTVTVEPGTVTTVDLSRLDMFTGTITFHTIHQANVRISWDGATVNRLIPAGETYTFTATPGTYDITTQLEPPVPLLGSYMALWETSSITISAGETVNIEIPDYPHYLGTININGPPQTQIIASWPTGTLSYTLPDTGTLSLWAAPGTYTFDYTIPAPPGYIGPPDLLTGTLTTTVDPGTTVNLAIPGPETLTGTLVITTVHLAQANIVQDGTTLASTFIDPGGSITYTLPPGTYQVNTKIEPPVPLIGSYMELWDTFTVTINPGTTTTLDIPDYPHYLAQITVTGVPSDTRFTITNGIDTLNPRGGDSVTVWATPGEYTISCIDGTDPHTLTLAAGDTPTITLTCTSTGETTTSSTTSTTTVAAASAAAGVIATLAIITILTRRS